MPQCAHCQTPYEAGERYCANCGSFLLHPDEGDTFCPKCGIRVSPRQEFCHECNAPLKGEAKEVKGPAPGAPPEARPASSGPVAGAPGMQPWLIVLLAGAAVVIVFLLILLFTRGITPPGPTPTAVPKAEAPAPAPTAPEAAPAKAPDLKTQLTEVLSTMREGHLKKDINLYMSVYSPTFPGLEDKRRNALKSWENYDYTNLVYTIDEAQPLDADNVIARATWYIDIRNRRTSELSSIKQVFQVRFAKEMGQWRILSLEEIQ
jgi:hypothetical protein